MAFRVQLKPVPFRIHRDTVCAVSKIFAAHFEARYPDPDVNNVMDLPDVPLPIFHDFVLWLYCHDVMPTRGHGANSAVEKWAGLYWFAKEYLIYELDKYVIDRFYNLCATESEKGLELIDIQHLYRKDEATDRRLEGTNLMRMIADILFYGKTKAIPWYDFDAAEAMEPRTGYRVFAFEEEDERVRFEQRNMGVRGPHCGVLRDPSDYYLKRPITVIDLSP